MMENKLKEKWIYETLITTRKNTLHCAPFGIFRKDEKILVKIYKGSTTLQNILETGFWCVNFPDNEVSFYNALFSPEKLEYSKKPETVPALENMPYVLCRLFDAQEKEEFYLISGMVIESHKLSDAALFNRASYLLMESLVLYTKRNHLEKDYLQKQLKENQRVIHKVAPVSEYCRLIDSILTEI